MSIELIIFIAMVATFIVAAMIVKLPTSLSLILAAIVGALVGGEGVPIRHLVEGTFSYVDTILVIATAMIFMKIIEESGVLKALSAIIIKSFHKRPAILLILIMFIIMFPGMITGSSTAAVLSAGSIMVPILLLLGVPKVDAATIIAMGGILGMVAPPVNIPAMIIGGGVDIPYVGFEVPLMLLTFPLAILFVLMLGYKHVKKVDYSLIEAQLDFSVIERHGFKIYLPLIILVILMIMNKLIPAIPDLGMPLIFLISAIVGIFTGDKVNVIESSKEAIKTVLPVMGILMGVGMFIQIMTLTGVRGFIVHACLSLPESLRYVAMAVSIPLFGAISAFGSASVLGVPFLLAFLAKDQIIVAAALSLLTGIGDMMPPTALAGIFAAQITGLDGYSKVLKKSIVPVVIIIVYAVLFIIFADNIKAIIG